MYILTGPTLQVTDPAPFFTTDLNSPFLDTAGLVVNLLGSNCQFTRDTAQFILCYQSISNDKIKSYELRTLSTINTES